MFLALAMLGCKPQPLPTPVDTDDTDTDTDTDTDVATPVPTGDTGPPVPTGDTAPEGIVVDCGALPSGPFPNEEIDGARSYHGMIFDLDGNHYGSDGSSLIRTAAPGDSQLFVPNVGNGEQMDLLPNGDIAWAQSGDIVRITPAGNRTVIVANVYAYGVKVGPDGFIYTANQNAVERIDPVTGARALYTTGIDTPKVINWNRDFTKFYVGTNSSGGRLYVYDVDPVTNLPGNGPVLLGETTSSWHDTLGVDICGNLYVAEFWDRRLWRFAPDGTRELLVDFNAIGQTSWYAHALEWGSENGPWDPFSIYVGQPYNSNTVRRIEIGVPSREYTGPVTIIPAP